MMTRQAALGYSALAAAGIGMVLLLFVLLPRWSVQESGRPAAQAAPGETATRKITAHLFFVAEDGLHLAAVEREVPYGDGTAEQATRIIEAQLEPAPAPYTSAIPSGTKLRGVFVSSLGEAFVDLSPEVSSAHPGGSLNELFTVYTIVDTLTTNLPAIMAVQVLIDGKEVDTLAGHVDLRRPLQENTRWVAHTESETKP
jgi:spore germination protein GerM